MTNKAKLNNNHKSIKKLLRTVNWAISYAAKNIDDKDSRSKTITSLSDTLAVLREIDSKETVVETQSQK